MTNLYVKKTLEVMQKNLNEARKQCIETYGAGVLVEKKYPINNTSRSLTCPAYWDTIACWPETPTGELAIQPCPSYVHGFLPSYNASRQCMENGVWFISIPGNTSWSNYTNCYKDLEATIYLNISKTEIPLVLQKYAPVIKFILELGYMISLSTLIIAFGIKLFLKRLHCARNFLHLHLFASFIMRAFFFLLISITFIGGVGLPSDLHNRNGSVYFHTNARTNNWVCKLMTSVMKYFLTANYSWMLMEGLYLHNLIFKTLSFHRSNSIKWYIILGWGAPLIVTVTWITARVLIEDTLCWTTQNDTVPFLIIAVPIVVSILVNLLLFMRISMVLYNNSLPTTNDENSYRYHKWVKSTLTLVPIFGAHYGIFLFLYPWIKTNRFVEVVWLFCDCLFGSFQGCFVAIILCFLNGEVRTEILVYIYYVLTFLATNKWSKHFFPCRKKFLRSIVEKSSFSSTVL